MEYKDNKYYLEVTVLTPRQEGMTVSCSIPFKYWNDTYTDWRRVPWQDNFLENAKPELYGNPSYSVCVYHHDVTYAIKRYLLARHKRWWSKVIRSVDANTEYHIKCKLPRLSRKSDLRDCEVTAIISKTVFPEDLLTSSVN